MFHRKMVIAVALALIMVLASIPAGWAGGPPDNRTGQVHADGGEGHPWDDGTSEETSPGEDPDDAVTGEITTPPIEYPAPTLTADRGFGAFVQSYMISAWKVFKVELKRIEARKTVSRGSQK